MIITGWTALRSICMTIIQDEIRMSEILPQSPGAPTLSRMERKARMTDEAFKSIVASENAARERKTARLRALRIEQEAAAAANPPAKTKKK